LIKEDSIVVEGSLNSNHGSCYILLVVWYDMMYDMMNDMMYDMMYDMIWWMIWCMLWCMLWCMIWYDEWYDVWYDVWYGMWCMIWWMIWCMICYTTQTEEDHVTGGTGRNLWEESNLIIIFVISQLH